MRKCIILLCTISIVRCDVLDVLSTTPEPYYPPRPYAFGYAAGRFAGNIDRTHSEISDGAGTVRGSYSYVDPRNQIRTVEYIADHNGFRSVSNKNPPPLPADSPIVAAAKERHLYQYGKIANDHQSAANVVAVPLDTNAVHYAKVKHANLFQQIAEEHARIAAERAALKLEFESTSEVNLEQELHN